MEHAKETEIGVTDFKAKCLGLIDQVAQGKSGRVLLTRHNKPVAALVPVGEEKAELWGAMRGTVKLAARVDLTSPTGEVWDAND